MALAWYCIVKLEYKSERQPLDYDRIDILCNPFWKITLIMKFCYDTISTELFKVPIKGPLKNGPRSFLISKY